MGEHHQTRREIDALGEMRRYHDLLIEGLHSPSAITYLVNVNHSKLSIKFGEINAVGGAWLGRFSAENRLIYTAILQDPVDRVIAASVDSHLKNPRDFT